MGKENEERTDRVDDRVLSDGASGRPAMPCIVHTSGTLTDTVYWLSADKELAIGRAPESDVCIRDMSISQHHARVVVNPAGEVFVEDLGSTNGTYVNGEKVVRHALWDGDKVHIGPHHVLKFCYQVNAAPEAAGRGEAAVPRDALTGIYARQYLLMRIDEDFIQAKMQHKDLALLLFDVDCFEEMKETHGPGAGDMVLREVAKVVSSVLRREDIFARYDNHTFVVLLRNLTVAEVVVLAQRIGRVVKFNPFLHEGGKIGVTVSLGIGSLTGNMKNAMDLISEAQAFLNKARRAGRDTINGSQSMRVIFRQMENRHVA
jgi:two-component system cell cycle response regulator